MPPRAGTGRTFIPLIRAPHADLPIPARGGAENGTGASRPAAKLHSGEVALWI
jgi:hypothetical protein